VRRVEEEPVVSTGEQCGDAGRGAAKRCSSLCGGRIQPRGCDGETIRAGLVKPLQLRSMSNYFVGRECSDRRRSPRAENRTRTFLAELETLGREPENHALAVPFSCTPTNHLARQL